jgi:peptidoglycan/LPS O-acetylase OafA/YrhL
MADNGAERLHALDAVRGFALIAGIFFHASVSFLPTPSGVPIWIIMDNQRSVALAVLFHVLHTFRMTTFFLIAGFFAHLTFHRRGARAFIVDRLKRIALPLVAGWPFVFAAVLAVTIWGAKVMAHGRLLPPAPPYRFPAFPWTHLWFLYVLLLLYAAIPIVRGPVALLDRGGQLRRSIDAVANAFVRSGLAPVVLAIPGTAALYCTPTWRAWFGIPTPDSSLVPNVAAATAFGVAFGFGWLAQRVPAVLEIWRRRWQMNIVLAVLFTTVGLRLGGTVPVIVPATPGTEKILEAACYMLASWTWTFGLIGMALRFLSNFSPVRRYIADASYWLYIIHLPIVMALQVAVSQLSWSWYAKYGFILGLAFPLMFASYALLVRGTFIGAILNGRRRPRTARPGSAQFAADLA